MITRLIVLGAIRRRGKAHGYQIRSDMKEWDRADQSTSIKPGSIYHALSKMHDEGLLSASLDKGTKAKLKKTEFSLTKNGIIYYEGLLQKCIESHDLLEFSGGLSFMHQLPKGKVVSSLHIALQKHKMVTEHLGSINLSDEINDPAVNPELASLWGGIHERLVIFIETLISKIENGSYTFEND